MSSYEDFEKLKHANALELEQIKHENFKKIEELKHKNKMIELEKELEIAKQDDGTIKVI